MLFLLMLIQTIFGEYWMILTRTFQNANYHIGRTEWEYWFDSRVNKVREDRIAIVNKSWKPLKKI